MKNILNYFLNKDWILNIVMRFLSEEKQKRIYIAKLRAEMLFFGHDISGMTDKEVEQGALDMKAVFAKAGLTIYQCAEAFKQLGKKLA